MSDNFYRNGMPLVVSVCSVFLGVSFLVNSLGYHLTGSIIPEYGIGGPLAGMIGMTAQTFYMRWRLREMRTK